MSVEIALLFEESKIKIAELEQERDELKRQLDSECPAHEMNRKLTKALVDAAEALEKLKNRLYDPKYPVITECLEIVEKELSKIQPHLPDVKEAKE